MMVAIAESNFGRLIFLLFCLFGVVKTEEKCDAPHPYKPAYGRRSQGRTTVPFFVGEGIYFFCNSGYKIFGKDVIICLSDGKWDAPVPSCIKTEFVQSDYAVRLMGNYSNKGRVEVFHKGIKQKHNKKWVRVCNIGWTLEDAQVVCRQLGYDPNKTRIPIYASDSIRDRMNTKQWGRGVRGYGVSNFTCT
ncbi:unnamed protein product, partial [Owenia fusiformis]